MSDETPDEMMAKLFEGMRKAGLKNASGIMLSARLGKVRMTWADGEHKDITPMIALRLANHLENAAGKVPGFFPLAQQMTVEMVPDGDYHGQKTHLVRLHRGDGAHIDFHPSMAMAYATYLRQKAAEWTKTNDG